MPFLKLKENYSILQCSLDKSGCNRIDVFICSHVVLLLSSDSLGSRLACRGWLRRCLNPPMIAMQILQEFEALGWGRSCLKWKNVMNGKI